MKTKGWISILKLFFAFGAFIALLMLYWSSLIVEEQIKGMRQEIDALKKSSFDPLKKSPDHQEKFQAGRFIDSSLPNLLTEDPFDKVLPTLLPPKFSPHGVLKAATVGVPENLHPFSVFVDVVQYTQLCNLAVSKRHLGIYETYAPEAALKLEERDLPEENAVEYWIHLREGLFWQPLEQRFFPEKFQLASWFLQKHPVTASDFKLMYDAIMNPNIATPAVLAVRQSYEDIISFKVIDPLTFAVRFKKHRMADGSYRSKYITKAVAASFSPLASFLYTFYPDGSKLIDDKEEDAYRNNSTWAQLFQEHWGKNVIPSCGAYIFQGMDEQGIQFVRNPDYFDPLAALVSGRQMAFKMTSDNIWQGFKNGEMQAYTLPAIQIPDWEAFRNSETYREQEKKGQAIKELKYPYNAYTFIGWNQKRPLFKSAKVRQAMTYAIDRPRIIREILHGMGYELSCPMSPSSNAYNSDLKPYPYDPKLAKQLLQEEGFYDSDGDGILDKQVGDEKLIFSFSLTYYSKNSVTRAISEAIATQLKEIGVQCNLRGVDIADLSQSVDEKEFDAYFLAWAIPGPPEDLKQIWHSSGANEKGSSNSVGFINPSVDKIIDELDYESDPKKRQKLYYAFDDIFYREQPYTLLYGNINTLLYREVLQNVFLPTDRKDLIPGANISEPQSAIYWLRS